MEVWQGYNLVGREKRKNRRRDAEEGKREGEQENKIATLILVPMYKFYKTTHVAL